MNSFMIRWVLLMILIPLTFYLMPGIEVGSNPFTLLAALVLGMLNALYRVVILKAVEIVWEEFYAHPTIRTRLFHLLLMLIFPVICNLLLLLMAFREIPGFYAQHDRFWMDCGFVISVISFLLSSWGLRKSGKIARLEK